MASNPVVLVPTQAARPQEVIFAGDGVRLAGQMEYPVSSAPPSGYPLLFVLPQASCHTREEYDDFAHVALDRGYAVFRWDKRGTGRSGSSGTGSAVQDAVNAYETALTQNSINRHRVVIMALGAGTSLLGSCFGLFARVQPPMGALLIANMLDETAITAINTRIQIVNGAKDWTPADQYAEAAAIAHQATYRYGADFYVTPDADRMLMTDRNGTTHLHASARKVISSWLHTLLHPSRFV
ncbi:MAG: hypothetical protein SF162_05885 [bacterium]|nr:hypothetical protein [bacterium]